MPNLMALARKLQTAINRAGGQIVINQKQFYSIAYGRVITRYAVKKGREVLCETYSPAELVQALAREWKVMKDG